MYSIDMKLTSLYKIKMKLYNEMKQLVRETYSNTSKQFDGYFKKAL